MFTPKMKCPSKPFYSKQNFNKNENTFKAAVDLRTSIFTEVIFFASFICPMCKSTWRYTSFLLTFISCFVIDFLSI